MQDQYGFIYDAVLESLICGETQIPAQNLPKAMQQLAATDDKHGKSGYEIQFGVRSLQLHHTSMCIHVHVYMYTALGVLCCFALFVFV